LSRYLDRTELFNQLKHSCINFNLRSRLGYFTIVLVRVDLTFSPAKEVLIDRIDYRVKEVSGDVRLGLVGQVNFECRVPLDLLENQVDGKHPGDLGPDSDRARLKNLECELFLAQDQPHKLHGAQMLGWQKQLSLIHQCVIKPPLVAHMLVYRGQGNFRKVGSLLHLFRVLLEHDFLWGDLHFKRGSSILFHFNIRNGVSVGRRKWRL